MLADDLETIPVTATFTGIRGVTPWYAIATNSLNPFLRIGATGISYKVLKTSQARFEDIEAIRLMTALKTVNLHFRFKTGPWTFTANVGTLETAQRVIALLPEHLRITV